VDLASGELVTDGEMEGRAKKNQKFGPPRRTGELERLALCVQETQNALLVHGVNAAFADGKGTEASLEYALKRGIEQAFQLEEGLGVERVGRGERRALLFYEAAEGGLGVLRRLAEEHDAVATVAREALRICHFSEDGRDLKPDCVQACYECLLSYANQSDAFLLDRQLVRDMLLGLAQCRVEPRSRGVSHQEHLESLRSRTQSAFERLFLNTLAEGGYRLPDDAQRSFQEPRCIVDFFYEPNVVVFCDGPPHDKPDQQRVDDPIHRELRSRATALSSFDTAAQLSNRLTDFPKCVDGGHRARTVTALAVLDGVHQGTSANT
jgi:hypothetical protein